MRTGTGGWALAAAVALLAAVRPAGGAEVLPAEAVPVEVGSVAMDAGGVVTGTLTNRTARTVRDVRLLVRYGWLWRDERAPHGESPGRAAYHTVPGEIPPGGTLRFVYRPETPLPARDDGRFVPAVEVVGFAEVGS